MQLDHETFEGVKELAEISQKISAGTAALAQLKLDEESYLDEREKKLVERLQQALVDSQGLISQIGENHSALIGYKTLLTTVYEQVLSLIQGVTEWKQLVESAATTLEQKITKHEQDVVTFKENARKSKIQIDGSFTELSAWNDRIGAERRKLDDDKKMFARAVAELKNK